MEDGAVAGDGRRGIAEGWNRYGEQRDEDRQHLGLARQSSAMDWTPATAAEFAAAYASECDPGRSPWDMMVGVRPRVFAAAVEAGRDGDRP